MSLEEKKEITEGEAVAGEGLEHPEQALEAILFAAGYPMCEALYDETISDEDIANIKDLPIWFLHAMTDGVVNPKETSLPTYERLVAAGATNVHFTYINDMPPFEMINHGVWVPGLKDEFNEDFDGRPVFVDGKPVTRFQWLAAQKRA